MIFMMLSSYLLLSAFKASAYKYCHATDTAEIIRMGNEQKNTRDIQIKPFYPKAFIRSVQTPMYGKLDGIKLPSTRVRGSCAMESVLGGKLLDLTQERKIINL